MRSVRMGAGAAVFLAALLLFSVEPMAAKRLLPVLGGSSAVWVTCLVFFQAALLLGYLYAHELTLRKGRAGRHAWMLGLGLAVVAAAWVGPPALRSLGMDVRFGGAAASDHPVRTIFFALAVSIGLPFLVLASTSPLVQVWLARQEGGGVRYRLFALSNAGSLLGLVLYPAVLEPRLTLGMQQAVWGGGFLMFAAVCGWLVWKVRASDNRAHNEDTAIEAPPTATVNPRTRWMWLLLPMGAAMQLSAVTSHLSQDVAAIPLLWVLPLGVYLVTFILAFEMPWLYRRWMVGRLLAVLLASLGYALSRVDRELPIGLAVLFYLAELGVACWFCHAEVYRLRPQATGESTRFYLLVAAGGVVGTFLVAIASPLIFRANYDLALSFVVTAGLALAVTWQDGWGQRLLWATGCALLLALSVALHIGFSRHALLQVRSFYGSLRVIEAEYDPGRDESQGTADSTGTGRVRVLMNGRIRHGTQMLEGNRRRMPTTYYGPESGVGVALRSCCTGRPKSIGVIGLGAGTLAAYGQPGDRIRFYEINPQMPPIARNLFTYLRDSPAQITVIEGDGRAVLNREPAQNFDVLVVDAFSGDAIPLHLLTREAMEVYCRHLTANGVIAFHVSNSYLDLAPEIAELAAATGLAAREVESVAVPAEGVYRASWVLVSADAAFFRRPEVNAASTLIDRRPGLRVWTDDYSSLLPVLAWRR